MPRALGHLRALTAQLGGKDAMRELRWMRQELAKSTSGSLDDFVQRRLRGEPLQYILGTQPFGELDLLVRAPVLIPRPETEEWTLRLADQLTGRKSLRILDICTGTGCIPLLLASHLDSAEALAVDISPEAVKLARENAARVGLSSRVKVAQIDLFANNFAELVEKQFGSSGVDVITANPPYIPRTEYEQLPHSVRAYEDPRALLGDLQSDSDDGLAFYPRIASLLPRLLHSKGIVAVEVGRGQSAAVRSIFAATPGIRRTEVWTDAWGIERTVLAFKE